MVLSRKRIITVCLVAVLVFVCAWYVHVQGTHDVVQAAENSSSDKQQLISVVGYGEIEVDPDVAYISLGIHKEGKDAEEAQSKNAEAFSQLKKTLTEKFKIEQKDLKSTSFQVYANYKYPENQEPKIVSYTARHTIQITTRDLDQVGALLDAATEAGANQIHQVRFGTERADEYQLTALEHAMNNAKSKADAIAKSMGASVKRVINVTESGFNGGNIYVEDMGIARTSIAVKEIADSATTISSGQIKISAQVHVEYEF